MQGAQHLAHAAFVHLAHINLDQVGCCEGKKTVFCLVMYLIINVILYTKKKILF